MEGDFNAPHRTGLVVKESIELLSKAMGVLDLIVSEIAAAGGISPSRAI